MRFKHWTMALGMVSAALLSACGSSTSNTSVRLINASVGYPGAMTVSVNNGTASSGVSYGTAGSYQSVNVSATTSSFVSGGVTILNRTPTLQANSNYSMIVYGKAGDPNISLLQENQTAPASGYASLLVLNLAQDAGPVDVYMSPQVTSPSGLTGLNNLSTTASNIGVTYGSGYNSVTAGSYEVRITGYNNKTDLRLDIPNVTVASGQVYTLVLTGSPSGVLVNGMLVQQQSTVTPYTSNSIRARLITALNSLGVLNSATLTGGVSTTASTVSLMPTNAASPQVGNYATIVDGTNAAASITVTDSNTQTQTTLNATPPSTIVPGTDYTILVWGNPASPAYAFVADDNTYPLSTGYANIRVVNGINSPTGDTAFNGGINLAANYNMPITGVAAGTQSANFAIPYAPNGYLLQVTTPGTPGATVGSFGGNGNNIPIAAGSLWVVYVLGDATWTTSTGQIVNTPGNGVNANTPNFLIFPSQLR